MECFKYKAMNREVVKPSLWSRYVDGSCRLETYYLRTSYKFTVETEVDGQFRFLDVSVMKKESSLTTTVYRKPSHTGRYLSTILMILCTGKREVFQSLAGRVYKLCHNEKDNRTELDLVKELATNAHTGKFVDCYQ